MRLGKVEVWITCEGNKLQEYGTELSEADNDETISCYVPSEAGKVSTHSSFLGGAFVFV